MRSDRNLAEVSHSGMSELWENATTMRVYLACTVRGDRAGLQAGRAMAERLEQHGHQVLTKHLLADDVEVGESELGDEEVYRRDLEWISNCDLLVAEASGSSYGVGFEVGFVLGRAAASGQRAVVFYDISRRHLVSRLITGNHHPSCRTIGYASIDELLSAIDQHAPPDAVQGPGASAYTLRTGPG